MSVSTGVAAGWSGLLALQVRALSALAGVSETSAAALVALGPPRDPVSQRGNAQGAQVALFDERRRRVAATAPRHVDGRPHSPDPLAGPDLPAACGAARLAGSEVTTGVDGVLVEVLEALGRLVLGCVDLAVDTVAAVIWPVETAARVMARAVEADWNDRPWTKHEPAPSISTTRGVAPVPEPESGPLGNPDPGRPSGRRPRGSGR